MYRFMKRIAKRILAAMTAAAALSFGNPALAAMPDILPLSEVAEGMEGTLYTVVDSTGDIVSFDAEILGVYRTDGSSCPTSSPAARGLLPIPTAAFCRA